jgi:SAM-dependent methyltransferase
MASAPVNSKAYRDAIAALLRLHKPKTILDLACGDGWLRGVVDKDTQLTGLDWYSHQPEGYNDFIKANLNEGIPQNLEKFDVIVCCEALHYMQNPGLLLSGIARHLNPGGAFIFSSPNPSHITARLNFLVQGFPRSYSRFVDNDQPTAHMPWLPMGFFQYWLLLGLNGFSNITSHEINEKKPKHGWEKIFGYFAKRYYTHRLDKASHNNEATLWKYAMTDQLIYGRQMVISANIK